MASLSTRENHMETSVASRDSHFAFWLDNCLFWSVDQNISKSGNALDWWPRFDLAPFLARFAAFWRGHRLLSHDHFQYSFVKMPVTVLATELLSAGRVKAGAISELSSASFKVRPGAQPLFWCEWNLSFVWEWARKTLSSLWTAIPSAQEKLGKGAPFPSFSWGEGWLFTG